MKVAEIRRYPVKSLLGETLPAATVRERGIEGDRLWAVRDADGKFGSGKNTRRFRRMAGLFDLSAYGGEPAPTVRLPDGREFTADDPAAHRAVSAHLGRPVTLAREAAVPHHDEGPVSLVTTAALARLTGLCGPDPGLDTIDPLRFRANLLLDLAGPPSFPEDDWPGRVLRIGPRLVLRVVRPLTRCVMIDMAQSVAPDRNDLLKTLADAHDMTFGVFAAVEQPGPVTVGDRCRWA
ncbi:MOSC domain-containing protein [Actinoplanes sp. LDG1-06]|uniref:MOSC domain-containing protein n=1 Tax=Paractinoplanes ovalisporus TaxID=2810368 RepID=A0ABS2AKH0_9ACTN|nr:MOSC N-terminal beta barrel domain-containing protein [Actinoplanes ovalisporus]MBM2619868.1 MOSC domain-containing protein [Actinoplanes ovalisporus]